MNAAMNSNRRRIVAAFLAAFLLAAPAGAQDYGDTPYVQTPQNVVDRMLEVAKVGARDYVIDLGSGDGRMIITAAKRFGARGFGVDLDRRLVTLSNRLAAKAGVADRAVFYERDIYQTDLTPARKLVALAASVPPIPVEPGTWDELTVRAAATPSRPRLLLSTCRLLCAWYRNRSTICS